MSPERELWLIRHGETDWSLSGQHTGRTDIPLTEAGREKAVGIRQFLAGRRFELVLTSPLSRALETCRIAGYSDAAVIEPSLREWDYGVYEGMTRAEIRERQDGWSIWSSPVPEGESIEQVSHRANLVIERAMGANGRVLMFAHGHFFRVLTARWLGLPADAARLFALDTAALSILGFERETRVIRLWNRSLTEQAPD
jgi:broad specificity phosphatase PhoE